MKRIIQIVDTYAYGDAIGNHVTAIYKKLKELGYDTATYANYIDSRLANYAQHLNEYCDDSDDIIFYHLSIGCALNRMVTRYKGKLVINYHNITPAHFMAPYNANYVKIIESGYADTYYLADKAAAVIADSDYNGNELRKMGYKCPIFTVPIIVKYDDYQAEPDSLVMNRYEDGIKNIVFVGRIAPNKKQEDVILDFYYYNKYFNPQSRLILVGNYNNGIESYYLKLKKYANKLGIKNIVFTGHIRFKEILAYYRVADLFLCESEHEGFCVPLVEAMYFDVPIVAYDSSAVGETLGEAGILLKEKNHPLAAAVMDQVIKDNSLQEEMKKQGKKRLSYFQSGKHIYRMIDILSSI